MKLPILVDLAQRDESGGIRTEENRWDDEYIINVINIARGELAHIVYNGDRYRAANKRLNPTWYQKVWLYKDENLQDDPCMVKFKCPPMITLDRDSDGARFIGTQAGSCEFKRIKNRNEIAQIRKHKVMNSIFERGINVLYDGDLQIWEVYTKTLLERMLVEALIQDPRSVSSYNIDEDEYPVPDDYVPMLLDIVKARLYPQSMKPADFTDDGKETAQPVANVRR